MFYTNPIHGDGNGSGGNGVTGVPLVTNSICRPATVDKCAINAVDNFVANIVPYNVGDGVCVNAANNPDCNAGIEPPLVIICEIGTGIPNVPVEAIILRG